MLDWNGTVTLGDVVSTAAFLAGLLAAYFRLSTRLAVLEDRVSLLLQAFRLRPSDREDS